MTRSIAESSNKRNVSLSVLMDAQLQRCHLWQSRQISGPIALGPSYSLANSDFSWLHSLCSRSALDRAWNRLRLGPLSDAKRATWVRFPPRHSGLNAPYVKIGTLLWEPIQLLAFLVVAILQDANTLRGHIACFPCVRNKSCPEAQCLEAAIFLNVNVATVQLFTLEECQHFSVGSAASVHWRTDMVLAIENTLLLTPNVAEEKE